MSRSQNAVERVLNVGFRVQDLGFEVYVL